MSDVMGRYLNPSASKQNTSPTTRNVSGAPRATGAWSPASRRPCVAPTVRSPQHCTLYCTVLYSVLCTAGVLCQMPQAPVLGLHHGALLGPGLHRGAGRAGLPQVQWQGPWSVFQLKLSQHIKMLLHTTYWFRFTRRSRLWRRVECFTLDASPARNARSR